MVPIADLGVSAIRQTFALLPLARHAVLFACVGLVAVLWSPPAAAQDAASISLGKRIFKIKADCGMCHGWSADGHGAINATGPSLRITELDRDGIIETVRCGRPGTGMPHHDKRAYTKDPETSCYGLTAKELGNDMPPASKANLRLQEIEGVADYLLARIVGRGEVTLSECQYYWGKSSKICQKFE